MAIVLPNTIARIPRKCLVRHQRTRVGEFYVVRQLRRSPCHDGSSAFDSIGCCRTCSSERALRRRRPPTEYSPQRQRFGKPEVRHVGRPTSRWKILVATRCSAGIMSWSWRSSLTSRSQRSEKSTQWTVNFGNTDNPPPATRICTKTAITTGCLRSQFALALYAS